MTPLALPFASPAPTAWHPPSPDVAPLTRGAFPTLAAALRWAAEHIPGAPFCALRIDTTTGTARRVSP